MTIVRISAFVFSLVTLVACETIEGAGQNLSSAGSAISDASNEVQQDL
ncbi:putative small secreted protein [Loktanella ponticola]|uniref:Putative small secreted protein n=1 Tax=Yoonia ponticola TaxID=1524255 RepID=A0A7W9EXD0_9RHOB|nr:entericidin A/B family lipoprotein [Yoonia ponticola]MBB5721568.1 putative small secreted protein [Yoonia ponticola]